MARVQHSTAIAVSFFALAVVHFANGLQMTVSPTHPQEIIDKSVKFSCTLGKDKTKYKEIFIMDIVKGSHTQIAAIRAGQDVTFMHNDVEQRYQAQGLLPSSGDLSRSFISLTLMLPRVDDSDTYACVISYLDNEGILQQDRENIHLEVTDPGATTKYLEKTVNLLVERVEKLEVSNAELKKQVKSLQTSCCNK